MVKRWKVKRWKVLILDFILPFSVTTKVSRIHFRYTLSTRTELLLIPWWTVLLHFFLKPNNRNLPTGLSKMFLISLTLFSSMGVRRLLYQRSTTTPWEFTILSYEQSCGNKESLQTKRVWKLLFRSLHEK